MTTPKTTFFLSNGTELVDIYPLESNGPVTQGTSNQSIPNEIVDIDYSSGSIIVNGDLSERLITLSANTFGGAVGTNTIMCQSQAEFDTLIAAGLEVGMFVEIPKTTQEITDGVFFFVSDEDTRVKITAIEKTSRIVTLSATLSTAVNARAVKFCYPFNVIDLDPSTPSPYVGEYGVTNAVYLPNKTTSISLSSWTPLASATFDVVGVVTGTNGRWIIQGITNGREIFYPGSTFKIEGNTFAQANGGYLVANTVQSQSYVITDLVIGATTSQVTVDGNVSDFFVVTTRYGVYINGVLDNIYNTLAEASAAAAGDPNVDVEPITSQQLQITQNTTHAVGSHPLNGTHDIIQVDTVFGGEQTIITIGTVVSGASGPANGNIQPTIPTTAITIAAPDPSNPAHVGINGLIISNTTATGSVVAGAPVQLQFAAPPAITPTTPHNYIVSWRVAGDYSNTFNVGHTVTIKNNNYYSFKRLTVDSVNVVPANDPVTGDPIQITEIRTIVTDPSAVTPIIGQSGYIIYPSPAVPYGHIQYTVLTPATSLQLVGRGVTHYNATTTWGQALQNNAIHHLENFANSQPPASPLNGQLWFNTAVPSMNVWFNGAWSGIVVQGMPTQGDVDMNQYSITNLGDAVNPQDAVNLRTADARYVNVAGDYMSGVLSMTEPLSGVLHKITDLADTDVPTGAVIDLNTANGTDALNMRTADARYVNVDGDTMLADLDMGMHRITNALDPLQSQDVATKSYVDSLSSGIVWLQSVLDPNLFDDTLAAPPAIADSAMLFYRSYIVKPTAYAVSGVNDALKVWTVDGDYTSTFAVGQTIEIKGNQEPTANQPYTIAAVALVGTETHITVQETIPSTGLLTISGTLYHAGQAWNGKHGHVMAWSGTTWVDVLDRPVQPGDRFGVYFEVDNDEVTVPTPGGSFGVGSALGTATVSAAGKIVTVNGLSDDYSVDWGTAPAAVYPPQLPVEPDAVSVLGVNSLHYGHSYTFRGQWGTGNYNYEYKWIEFAGPSMLVDGAGLKYTGNILNVGQGTGILVSANAVGINPTYFNNTYMRRDGTTAFTADISMDNHRLVYVTNPVDPQDAVNKRYVDDNFMSLSGMSTMIGDLDMGGFAITNLAAPSNGADAVTKDYADTKVAKAGDTMTGPLSMSDASGLAFIDMGTTNKIVNLADPVNARDAMNLQTSDGRYVRKIGGVMTGALTLSGDPTQVLHAATKQYVDNSVADATTAIQSAAIDGGAF